MRDAWSLYAVQLTNYLFPLLTVPFLVRVLGPDQYGQLAFAQGITSYLSILVDYGFGLSASRSVARLRDDVTSLRRVVSGVVASKSLLYLVGWGALIFLFAISNKVAAVAPLLVVYYLGCAATVITPAWLFQGLQRLTAFAWITTFSRAIYVGGVVSLVRSPNDSVVVAGVQAVTTALTGVLSLLYVRFRLGISLQLPQFDMIKETLHESTPLFLAVASKSLYDQANVVLIGFFLDAQSVGYYAAAERIIKAAIAMIWPLSQAVYPYMARAITSGLSAVVRARARLLLMVFGTLGIFLTGILFIGAPVISRVLLGPGYGPSTSILRGLSWLPLLYALNNALGTQLLLPLGGDREAFFIVLLSGIVNLLLAFVLLPTIGPIGMVISVVAAECTALVLTIAALGHRAKCSDVMRSQLK